jgi:hypothetical protein
MRGLPAVEDRTAWDALNIRARPIRGGGARDDLFFKAAGDPALGCRDCHGRVIYDHRRAARTRSDSQLRFASLYNGTDIRAAAAADALRQPRLWTAPLAPRSGAAPNTGRATSWFPATAGNCAACLPAAAL